MDHPRESGMDPIYTGSDWLSGMKKGGTSVIVGAKTRSPLLKHSLASSSTVAYVMYRKYVNSIPFYCQEADWKQMG